MYYPCQQDYSVQKCAAWACWAAHKKQSVPVNVRKHIQRDTCRRPEKNTINVTSSVKSYKEHP